MRLFPQRSNPLCQRLSCDHPLKGARREGHFDMGAGPCKAPGCTCTSFVYTEPVTLPRVMLSSHMSPALGPNRPIAGGPLVPSLPPMAAPPQPTASADRPEQPGAALTVSS